MVDEDIKQIAGIKKIRLFMTPQTDAIIKNWIGTARYTNNQANYKIKKENFPVNFQKIRNEIIPKKKIEHDWILKTPKDIRAEAIRDLITSYKAAFSNLKNGNIKKFNMRYKKKIRNNGIINIPKSAIKIKDGKLYIYKTYNPDPIKIKEKIEINHSVKIQNINGKWYMIVPYSKSLIKNHEKNLRVTGIDPGEISFITGYDDKGDLYRYGKDDMKNKIVPIFRSLDSCQSKVTKGISNRKTKYNMKKKKTKLETKIKNKIKDIHYKSIKHLTDNYDVILLGKIGIKNMTKGKCLHRKVKRRLLHWSHCSFRRRLHDKCKHTDSKLFLVEEHYTSRCCCVCGHQNKPNDRIYLCKSCKSGIDRDGNSGVNMMLKGVVEKLKPVIINNPTGCFISITV